MIKIEHVDVVGWEPAIRGMRNPMNSWDKSDSGWVDGAFLLGPNDIDLMHRLYVGGSEHRKFMRMLIVTMDITAPLYWWKEFDTYKIGTVANSCSTMHTIHKKAFELDDFSWNQLLNTDCDLIEYTWQNGLFKKMVQPLQLLTDFIIPSLNVCREKYLETKDKKYWWQMIQLLPSSYNQRRTVMMNYEVAERIIRQRSGHKLDEWHELIDVLRDLPYMHEISTGCTKDYCPIDFGGGARNV
jgi:hypothetical protein